MIIAGAIYFKGLEYMFPEEMEFLTREMEDLKDRYNTNVELVRSLRLKKCRFSV